MMRRLLNSRLFLAGMFLLVLVIGLSVASAQRQLNATRTEEANMRRRLATLKDSISTDTSGSDLKNASGDYVIEEAKRRLDYKDPQENVVLIVRGNSGSLEDDTTDQSHTPLKQESHWQKWWEYVMGK
jgi:cell division protein FtsB